MENKDRHPECHMRTALGNCVPIGGFCTSVNEPICEALHKVSRPNGEWIADYGNIKEYRKGSFLGFVQKGWSCSECGCAYSEKHNFCPNCGADMREE